MFAKVPVARVDLDGVVVALPNLHDLADVEEVLVDGATEPSGTRVGAELHEEDDGGAVDADGGRSGKAGQQRVRRGKKEAQERRIKEGK